ncbi:tyrosine-type recombinase/integrase [Aquirufa aurantiipilula]|uniref:tyrosine-type recombinase/integrase n=1 Tax=Aquirufa aurantiipilula TaxID=2696561 RepID=UPI001CAA56AC|nr:site-specific integrase [Aquirufa aurantiipilula]MBZ1325613.1 site-specific integrase [Aquirufa aurantiipilula]
MVSFYIRNKKSKTGSIRCCVQPKGQRRFSFTVANSKIDISEWGMGQMKTGKGKQANSQIQNRLNRLRDLTATFYSLYYQSFSTYPTQEVYLEFLGSNMTNEEYFEKPNKVKLLDLVERITLRRITGKELNKGKEFSHSTIQSYNSLILSLKKFQEIKGKKHYYLEEWLKMDIIEEYEHFLTEDRQMSLNTIHNRLKVLKAFLQIGVNEGLIPFNPFKKFKKVLYTEDSDVVVFTKQELNDLEELDFSDNPYYDRIRDQYLLYLWSGVRKSDLKNLVKVINPTTKVYTFRAEKTGETCQVPAFETLRRLGEKYDYNFPDPYSDTIILEEIKNICQLIPSMRITVEKKSTKGGKKVREYKKKYQMIVIHTARRTLATLLVDAGLPYHQVMKITGHKKLTTLQKYIKSEADVDGMLAVGNGLLR